MAPLGFSWVLTVEKVLLGLQQQGVIWARPDRASRSLTADRQLCSLLLSLSTQPGALLLSYSPDWSDALLVDLEAIAVRRRRF